jgi:hypothetical protein
MTLLAFSLVFSAAAGILRGVGMKLLLRAGLVVLPGGDWGLPDPSWGKWGDGFAVRVKAIFVNKSEEKNKNSKKKETNTLVSKFTFEDQLLLKFLISSFYGIWFGFLKI